MHRWEPQPTIAWDGSFIIFSGDTSNGDDHKDLYISQRQSDGSFGPPRNMGATVNSSDREVSPFLAPDGRTLFFASDRSGGYGGADFYITQQNARGEWSTPKNLGPLINSSANELFFYGASRAYCMFVSDRDGGQGGFDLYEAAPNIFAPSYTMVQLTIMDTVANRAVSGSVKVTGTRLGKIISTDRAEAERGIRKELPAGIGYRFEVTADGYPGTRRAEIPTLPAAKGCTPAQLALAWVLSQGDHIIPIPGTKKREYLIENAAAVDIRINEDDRLEIENLIKAFPNTGPRYNEDNMKYVDR